MINHHYKRHFNHLFSYVIYCLLMIYFFINGVQLSALELSTLSVNIGIVDNADNTISQQYIEDLSQHAILKLNKTDAKQAMALLEREILDLLIVIPKDYTPNHRSEKIDYYYLKRNVVAPATLDLIAVDLMPHVIENRLIAASKLYHIGDETTARNGFRTYLDSLSDNFSVTILTVDHASQIREEQAIITLTNAKNNLLFALFSIILVAALPLSLRLKTNIETQRRLSLSKRGVVFYFLSEHLLSYIYLILLWSVAVIAIAVAIQLNTDLTLLIFACGCLTIITYYELFRLLLNNRKQDYISSLLALFLVVLPAILGGVFFDANLLPAKLFKIASVLPFNFLEKTFYNGLSLLGNKVDDFILLVVYFCLALTMLSYNLLLAKRTT